MTTASGEEHGIINVISNHVPYDGFKHMSPEHKAQIEKEKKEDAKLVKARYINHSGMHERLEKPYCKYAGDPIYVYRLIPGHTYELPMGFIKEVNQSKGMPRRSGLQEVDGQNINKDGSPLEKDMQGNRIHELVPTSF